MFSTTNHILHSPKDPFVDVPPLRTTLQSQWLSGSSPAARSIKSCGVGASKCVLFGCVLGCGFHGIPGFSNSATGRNHCKVVDKGIAGHMFLALRRFCLQKPYALIEPVLPVTVDDDAL